jgi:hypothetical protein
MNVGDPVAPGRVRRPAGPAGKVETVAVLRAGLH